MKEIIFSRQDAKYAKKNLCDLGVLARVIVNFDSYIRMLVIQGFLVIDGVLP